MLESIAILSESKTCAVKVGLNKFALKLSNPCMNSEEHWIELTDEGSMFITHVMRPSHSLEDHSRPVTLCPDQESFPRRTTESYYPLGVNDSRLLFTRFW